MSMSPRRTRRPGLAPDFDDAPDEEGPDGLPSGAGAAGTRQPPHVTVVLPCYDEEDHVVAEIERICGGLDSSGYTYELLVIDDGSTDRTWELVEATARDRPAVHAIHLPRNGGPGTARRLGTQRARGDVVVWTDADMTYPNDRIPDLVRILDEDSHCDQVVGARSSEQGTHRWLRMAAKWFIRKLAERLTRTEIPDLNSGLRAFRRDAAVPYVPLLPPGFSCVTTISLAFLANHQHVRYLPVSYAPRSGTSKFRVVRDACRYLLQVLVVVTYFSPTRVLMPVALVLLALGTVMTVQDLVVAAETTATSLVVVMAGLVVATQALVADVVVRSRSRGGPSRPPVAAWPRPPQGSERRRAARVAALGPVRPAPDPTAPEGTSPFRTGAPAGVVHDDVRSGSPSAADARLRSP